MKEVDVASDWRVDPVLKNACQDVVTAACDPSLGTDHVMVSQNVQYVFCLRYRISSYSFRVKILF